MANDIYPELYKIELGILDGTEWDRMHLWPSLNRLLNLQCHTDLIYYHFSAGTGWFNAFIHCSFGGRWQCASSVRIQRVHNSVRSPHILTHEIFAQVVH